MRKIVIMYMKDNVDFAERLGYELANQILVTTKNNSIINAERVTPLISRIEFKLGSEIIVYPIEDYGLYGMKVTDIYIDENIIEAMSDSRMFALTKVYPALMSDRLCDTIYDYQVPIEERFKTWKFCKNKGFVFNDFMKKYKDVEDGNKNG